MKSFSLYTQKALHIVSFDIPYPANYGGAIDVYYKLQALKNAGCKIYLHCYEYGRQHAEILAQYCEQVWYYPRSTGLKGVSATLPYIVSSRRSKLLLERLIAIDAPILFEGVHCAYHLNNPELSERFKAIRIHNIEHEYYAMLAQKEPLKLKQVYFNIEARRLRRFEHQLQQAQAFFALSQADHLYFKELYPAAVHSFIPPFHPYQVVNSLIGSGTYCLYHGNLSHPENREAAFFLLKNVIPDVEYPFIIAGKDPAGDLIAACNTLKNCTLLVNPNEETMIKLVSDAHIHVIPTFQESGMKLKLLSALFGGRHVLVNKSMLYGTGMPNDICSIAATADEFVQQIKALTLLPFTGSLKEKRDIQLAHYQNDYNAQKLLNNIGL